MTDKSTVPKVGDQIWVQDPNIREYAKNEKGQSVGPPLLLPQWELCWVVLVSNQSIHVSKSREGDPLSRYTRKTLRASWYDGKSPPGYKRTYDEVLARVWADDNHHEVGRCVQGVRDPVLLAKIADLIDYCEPTGRFPRPEHLKNTKE